MELTLDALILGMITTMSLYIGLDQSYGIMTCGLHYQGEVE